MRKPDSNEIKEEVKKEEPEHEELPQNESFNRSFEKTFGIVFGTSVAWYRGAKIVGHLGNSLDLVSKTGREGRVTFKEAFDEKMLELLERRITPPTVDKVEWF